MPFRSLKVLAILALCTLMSARAEEKEGESKGGPALAVDKDQKEFTEKSARLTSLTIRITEAEKLFKELVTRKAEEKNPEEKQRLIKQMNDAVADRNKAEEEYNKVKADLTLRYPNQGEHLERNYQTQKKKGIEELQSAAGLDELLTRTKKLIEKKFATFNPDPPPDAVKPRAAAPVGGDREEEKKPLRLEK